MDQLEISALPTGCIGATFKYNLELVYFIC